MLDAIASKLEQFLKPKLHEARRECQRTYMEIYTKWATDPIHSTQAYDTERCARLLSIAHDHAKELAVRYDSQELFYIIRTIPISAIGYITLALEGHAIELIKTAGTFVLEFGTEQGFAHRIARTTYIFYASDGSLIFDLPRVVGTLLGAASAWSMGEKARRYAGKGGRLKAPEPTPDFVWAQFDSYPEAGFLILPTPDFIADAALEASTFEYDTRRMRHQSPMVSAVLIAKGTDEELNLGKLWWLLGRAAVSIFYPVRDIQINTNSHWVWPESFAMSEALIMGFPEAASQRLGFKPAIFCDLCGAVGQLILREIAYGLLSPVHGSDEMIRLVSGMPAKHPGVNCAPEALFSICARGFLRNRKPEFVRVISIHLQEIGYKKGLARSLSKQFIDKFTRIPSIEQDLHPSLFVPLGSNMIGLDLIQMQDFFEFIIRILLAGGGREGHEKGMEFEKTARRILTDGLQISPAAIPLPPNTKLSKLDRGGRDYGDVDFAFIRDDILVHLDMKSYSRNEADFRGDYLAVRARISRLIDEMTTKVEPRGAKVLEIVRRSHPHVRAVLNLLCVGVVEYLPWGVTTLRYGDEPGVLTPAEVVDVVSDKARLVAMANRVAAR